MLEGSGSIQNNNGSGSERPKNIRILYGSGSTTLGLHAVYSFANHNLVCNVQSGGCGSSYSGCGTASAVTLPEPVYSSYPQFSYGQGYNPGLSQVGFLLEFLRKYIFDFRKNCLRKCTKQLQKIREKKENFDFFERFAVQVRTISLFSLFSQPFVLSGLQPWGVSGLQPRPLSGLQPWRLSGLLLRQLR